jgi:glycosyltransferase involved in cell wall biosynthesis
MRILFVLHQFFPEFASGTERVALNLARMAQRAGHHVHVLAGSVDPLGTGAVPVEAPFTGCFRLTYDGLPVTLLPRRLLPPTADIGLDADESLADQVAAWMQQQRFEVAHVLHTMRTATAVLAAQRCGLPYVITLTDFFVPCARINLVTLEGEACDGPQGGRRCAQDCLTPPWTPDTYRQRYEQASALLAGAAERVAPSEFVARRYRESFPDLAFRVIPHGIDLLALADPSAKAAPRDPAGPLRLVYAGVLVPQKGLNVLLRALALLDGRNLTLTVLGAAHGDPAYHREVRALAAADPRVELMGALEAPQVFAQFRRADLLCLPSQISESYSLVLHEAAAAGASALVSDLGAPAERVGETGAGRVVAHADPRAWAEAIAAVLDQPQLLPSWQQRLPLPLRVEEEAFFYESLYARARRSLP